MRSPAEIKKIEREAQAAYVRNLYTTLPREPITTFEFELERAIWRDIHKAEAEYAIM